MNNINNKGKPDNGKTVYQQAIAPYASGGLNSGITAQNVTYTTVGVVTDRALSDPAAPITVQELGHILGTLIQDLKASGIIK